MKLSCQHINELKTYVCKCEQVEEFTTILSMVTQCLNAFLFCTEKFFKLPKAEYTKNVYSNLISNSKKNTPITR